MVVEKETVGANEKAAVGFIWKKYSIQTVKNWTARKFRCGADGPECASFKENA